MTLTLDQYRRLLGDKLADLTDDEVRAQYDADMTIAAFVLKCWLRQLKTTKPKDGTIDPS